MTENNPPIDFVFQGSFADAVNTGVALAILICGAISIFYLFFGGIQFITSSGEEEKTKKAVTTIRYSIIGLLIVIFAVTAVSVIGLIFNMNILEPLQWNTITDLIQKFSDMLSRQNSVGGGQTLN